MPKVNVTSRGEWDILGKTVLGVDWGCSHLRPISAMRSPSARGERILVLGTGEFVWEPFLLAERLEAAGAQALYGSTTRSPIAVGYAIESAISFTDNYGLGIPNFVYNVAHQQFDRILVCTETPAESIDTQLLKAPG